MSEELYKKYRPKNFKEMVGQDAALKSLIEMGRKNKLPHSILFTGPSGVGKTTAARILARKLKCGKLDYHEVNGAQVRGIDSIRDLQKRTTLMPISGKVSVWVIDEIQKITSDAADGLLKTLEDTDTHVYFLLCTTDPQKLKRTIRTRCHLVDFKPISDKCIGELVSSVAKKEEVDLDSEVVAKIEECSEGSARQAMVFLHAVLGAGTVEEQLESISKGSTQAVAIDIARALYDGVQWRKMAGLLKKAQGEEADSIRWVVMGYAKAVLLNKGDSFSARVIDCFRDNFFDTKHNGLALACWEVLNGD